MRIWLKRAVGRRPDYIELVGAAVMLFGISLIVTMVYTHSGDRASTAIDDISARIDRLAAHKR
jgi:hypothetical protein